LPDHRPLPRGVRGIDRAGDLQPGIDACVRQSTALAFVGTGREDVLRQLRTLTGYDLGAVDVRLNLHIAARTWQLLNAAP
jgi:hypothetical protein